MKDSDVGMRIEPNEKVLYGPWMTVDSQCRRNTNGKVSRSGPAKEVLNETVTRSRFSLLLQDDGLIENPIMGKKQTSSSHKSVQPELVSVSNSQEVEVIPQTHVESSDKHTAVTLMDKSPYPAGLTGGKILKARGSAG
ncbi:hypothetical protein V6N12_067029 [Hibiscus sabdariffa]|uniref:Uncharacterized protein n=1 Tax=Hibiscus sabdariffa TaxID=183260 RepID=A0ABR2BKL2_9ROSI